LASAVEIDALKVVSSSSSTAFATVNA